MAEWKKVLVSGSNIHVNQITASGLTEVSKPHVVVYDTQSGALHYTASSAVGGSSVQYQTGSDPLTILSQLKIIDYSRDVFVTASGGQLILQFGTASIPTGLSTAFSGFNTDRFSGPGAGSYVVDAYDVIFSYTTGSGNILLSASLLQGTTTVATNNTPGTTSTTFNILTTSPYASGSQNFTGSLHVQLEDGSKVSYNATPASQTLSKTNPADPTLTFSYSGLTGTTTYVSNNTANNYSNSNIENGVTGTITYTSASGTTNGWTLTSLTSLSSPSPITVTATGSITLLSVSGAYSSNGLGTPLAPSSTIQRTKLYSRIVSLRSGASPNSSSFTEAELLDLTAWTGGGEVQNGTINFNTTSIPNNTNVTINNSTSAYLYIIYGSSSADLTNIKQGGFDVTGNFTKTTVGLYKVYRTTLLQSAGSNAFVLNAT